MSGHFATPKDAERDRGGGEQRQHRPSESVASSSGGWMQALMSFGEPASGGSASSGLQIPSMHTEVSTCTGEESGEEEVLPSSHAWEELEQARADMTSQTMDPSDHFREMIEGGNWNVAKTGTALYGHRCL
eukprot:4355763-Amphidinium_carterae.1